MADVFTQQTLTASVSFLDSHVPPRPAQVQNPVWVVSDPVMATIVQSADGLSAEVVTVGIGTFQVGGTADADLGDGVVPISWQSEDINVTQNPNALAAVAVVALGAPSDV